MRAKITAPRVIDMAGDHADDEGKVAALNRLVFNDEPTAGSVELASRLDMNTAVEAGVSYSASLGRTSFDSVEGTLVSYVESGS